MASWANLTLDSTILQGIAPVDLYDPDTGAFDETRSTVYLDQAKGYIQMRLMREIPMACEKAGGPEEFLDAAVDIAKDAITTTLQQLLSYAFLIHYYDQQALGMGSVMFERMGMMREKFDMTLQAFVRYIMLDEDFVDQVNSLASPGLTSDMRPVWVG
jgi:hypothetical protein